MSTNSSSLSPSGAAFGSYQWTENNRLVRQLLAKFIPPSRHSPSSFSADSASETTESLEPTYSAESSRLTMSPPGSQSLDSVSISSRSRVADPTYARPVPSDPFFDHNPEYAPTPHGIRLIGRMRHPKSDVSSPGSTPVRHINRHRNPRDNLPLFHDPELGTPWAQHHDRYEKNPRFESPTPRQYSRFRPPPPRRSPSPGQQRKRVLERKITEMNKPIPQGWWVDKKHGWTKAPCYTLFRSCRTGRMVDISKLPQATKRLSAMACGHVESPGLFSPPLTVGPIGGQPAKALPLAQPDVWPALAKARLLSYHPPGKAPVVPAGVPSEQPLVRTPARSRLSLAREALVSSRLAYDKARASSRFWPREQPLARSPAPSPSSRCEQSFASDTFPPVPPFVPSDESREVSFTTIVSSAFSDPTEYPDSEETTDAFLHEDSIVSVSDFPESPRPPSSPPTFVSTGVQVSPPTFTSVGVQAPPPAVTPLVSVGVQVSPPAPATLVSVGVQATPDPTPATRPSFFQLCWNWIDSKVRSWFF